MSEASFSLLLAASRILALLEQQLRGIPVPAASPGTGWAGVTGVNGAVVTQLRVLILHCGLCVQLLIALCRGWRVRQPRIRGASGAGSPSLLWCSWNAGALGTAPAWRDPRARQGSPPPQTGIETPPSHSRFREAFGAISILPVPASSLSPHPPSPGWQQARSRGQGAGTVTGMLTAS